MSSQEPQTTSQTSSLNRNLAIGAALLIAGCVLGYFVQRLSNPPPPPDTVTIVRPTPSVVVAMRDLSRLETAEFHVERVIDLRDQQERMFGLIQTEDAILLVASGEAHAGVDLGSMADDAVDADPETGRVTITLPPPELFSVRLDNERTFVHSRTTDVLARRSESLETRARQEAERSLENAAIEGGILDRAKRNAERTVRALVSQLGYEEIEIRWAAP